ncbi:hypothetical protein LSAT2_017065, partial [Lamellibrachia satsuma]
GATQVGADRVCGCVKDFSAVVPISAVGVSSTEVSSGTPNSGGLSSHAHVVRLYLHEMAPHVLLVFSEFLCLIPMS